METKHTKGPWHAANRYEVKNEIGLIARVATAWAGNGTINANARLIAAAPDMLEALRDIREHAAPLVQSGDPLGLRIDAMARAIINRIEEGE